MSSAKGWPESFTASCRISSLVQVDEKSNLKNKNMKKIKKCFS